MDAAEPDEPAVLGPRTQPFESVCFACGRSAADYVLTADEFASLEPQPNCPHCGGRVFLEPLFTWTRAS